jgi:hypothetical protein
MSFPMAPIFKSCFAFNYSPVGFSCGLPFFFFFTFKRRCFNSTANSSRGGEGKAFPSLVPSRDNSIRSDTHQAELAIQPDTIPVKELRYKSLGSRNALGDMKGPPPPPDFNSTTPTMADFRLT